MNDHTIERWFWLAAAAFCAWVLWFSLGYHP